MINLVVNRAPTMDIPSEVSWRIHSIERYIATIDNRIDRIQNGWYRTVKRKNGTKVQQFYRSEADYRLWLPYRDVAANALIVARAAMPSDKLNIARMSLKAVKAIVGGLSNPEKMPCFGYNLPAEECNVGSIYRDKESTPCYFCYARKGRYVFHDVVRAMYRRLASLRHPNWSDAMVRLISHYTKKCTSPYCAYRDRVHGEFRWHDAGDLAGVWHLQQIVDVAKRTPDIIHWIPTQEWRVVKRYRDMYGHEPVNLIIRKSSTQLDTPNHPWKMLDGIVASYVNTGAIEDDEETHYCPSRLQEGKCGDCRACWDRDVRQVAYHVH